MDVKYLFLSSNVLLETIRNIMYFFQFCHFNRSLILPIEIHFHWILIVSIIDKLVVNFSIPIYIYDLLVASNQTKIGLLCNLDLVTLLVTKLRITALILIIQCRKLKNVV